MLVKVGRGLVTLGRLAGDHVGFMGHKPGGGGGAVSRFLYAGVPLGDLEPHPVIRRVNAEILTLF